MSTHNFCFGRELTKFLSQKLQIPTVSFFSSWELNRKFGHSSLLFPQENLFNPYLSFVVRKLVFGVSDQVPHKPGCTSTEDV